ncbi:MAG TPA: hypothetical protein VNO32_60390, partial [Candidatus Acidoferrum sp.]|nr:hypothetical protein [Candidatus Acidoferrum sp.]
MTRTRLQYVGKGARRYAEVSLLFPLIDKGMRVSKLRGQREDLRVSISVFRPGSVISTASPYFVAFRAG